MTLIPGTRLGPYEVLAPLGAGGMGEVYRARDTRPAMAREVAIKLVTGLDAESRARFERESRVTASLAHPNVVALFDVGAHEGTPYLVEELLTGETLRERLRSGPVAARKAVEWIRQATLGLAAAHARDLVHRDVKPENLFLTSDGVVKMLDFGLAKAATAPAPDATTAAQAATGTGDAVTSGPVVLGTVGYMSPEQVRGQTLDHRSDLFSVGVVLYELLTGRRPFDRATPADTMSAILTADPEPWATSVAPVPAALERLVARCLEKTPADRFQSTRDMAFALETAVNASGAASGAHQPGPPRRRVPAVVGVAAGVAGLALAFTAGRVTSAVPPAPRAPTRLQLTVDGQLTSTFGGGVAVSHDGRTLALSVLGPDGVRRIHTRRLDEATTRVVPETEGGGTPFFSPDNRALGFAAGNDVGHTALSGGAPQLLWRSLATTPLTIAGFDWYGAGSFVLGPGSFPLSTLARGAETPRELAPLVKGELGHLRPQVLRDGAHVLYVSYPINDSASDARVMLQPINGGEPRLVLRGSRFARQFADYLVFESGGSLVAARFDTASFETRGPVVKVVEDIGPRPGNVLAVGGNQTLAYLESDYEPEGQLEWIGPDGASPTAVPPLVMLEFAVSPDGSTIAATGGNLGHYLVAVDVRTGTTTRLTDGIHAHGPLFTPDGAAVVFAENGALRIVELRAGSVPRPYGEGAGLRVPYGWMPDGRSLLYTEVRSESGADIWSGDLTSGTAPTLLVRTPTNDRHPAVSPGGGFLAFTSEEGGRQEVFVQPLKRTGPRRRVTLQGGTSPVWSHDGRRLYWRWADQILSVDVDGAGVPQGRPVLRANGRFVTNQPYTSYAVDRDGRLLVSRLRPLKQVNTVNVVLNADVEIERLITEAEAKR